MRVMAIDPANIQSGWCIVDSDTYKPLEFGKSYNAEVERKILFGEPEIDHFVIEQVKSYGMVVGQTVFDTCVQIGRFQSCIEKRYGEIWSYVPRKEYITDLTGSPKAKDANVIQYLVDRFAPNTPNKGKGTVKNKGWFYGFAADVWQSYAIAIWYCDKINKKVW